MMIRFSATAAAVALGCYGMATSVHAANDMDSELDAIERIEVHAQRRPQDLHDVSVAVTLIDGEQLQQRQIKDAVELANLVPNFVASQAAAEGTTPAFTLRGVGMFDYNTSTVSPIAIYSDEVVSGGANFMTGQLFDLERVEVLRGPQGTLFGRNTTGGAILLRSRLPEYEFGGYVRASAAEQQSYRIQGAVNAPLTDTTAARFAFNWQDYQYSMNNLFPGASGGGMEQASFRLLVSSEWQQWSVLWRLHSEHWTGQPKPVYSAGVFRNLETGEWCSPAEVGSRHCVDNFGFSVPSDDFWTTSANTQHKRNRTDSWGTSLQLERELSAALSLKSITAYKSFNRFHSWDADGPGQFIEGVLGSDNDFFSQELTLFWQQPERFWTAGLFYLNERLEQNNELDLFRDFRAVPALADVPATFIYHNQLRNEAMAAYAQLEQQLSPDWQLVAGLRLTDEQTRYHANADLDTVAFYLADLWDLGGKVADTELSGKLALLQRLNPRHSLYYSYSRGYKSGGYNAGFSTSPEEAADSSYDPEYLDAWELGSRWRSSDASLLWDLALFYYQYRDQQSFVNISTGTAPYHVLKNAGDGRVLGLESDWRYRPLVATELMLSLGYIPKAKLGEYREGDILVSGTRLPFTPEWTLAASFTHQQQLAGQTLDWQLGVRYQSAIYFDQYEDPYARQQGYALWHGRLGWQATPDLELALWGKNLFNQRYAELKFDSVAALGAYTQLRGEARQLGLEVRYQF
ncbi:TonB-dependent receptor [Alkalimonas delamerensis]|uniref:TonB-dependent receptor n=1 Tax=Alkalimonas delamerensis TaxID=265981 RepID=A0ABT9GPL3_9GAMM|nr:TonB-dependent receptor [Alkalimonas delamerensis]MDP4528921.1 TonB-dependent receptor [Alkalimonas delamerensis]